ncbi:hypothetical protein BO85DRAFT_91097 [Aspergillus piperis CBS 112811]|uniref:Uncharacterized protein n=1 Tax=Aspergillus piperis CBS 112811 TaxID=1448313 RepID=A0A8G1VJU8_9EURO|nr:hypothetical protein BO85DRAFT_91097 [Aspergillus piperis CBS 112811]RAH55040.1 hypothetical protein BO85DRAFT_91097 [Aspergillus piperis CBS 112811]
MLFYHSYSLCFCLIFLFLSRPNSLIERMIRSATRLTFPPLERNGRTALKLKIDLFFFFPFFFSSCLFIYYIYIYIYISTFYQTTCILVLSTVFTHTRFAPSYNVLYLYCYKCHTGFSKHVVIDVK